MNRRSVLSLLGLTLMPAPSRAAERLQRFAPATSGTQSLDHRPFGELLRQYVRASADGVNRVNYGAWRASEAKLAALRAYIAMLEMQNPQGLTHDDQLAYWANLYNAETLRIVLAAWPVKSILSIRPTLLAIGPWKKPTLVVGGEALSLDDIENGILRPQFHDPRVHYALNCASTSCPNLNVAPWQGATLDRDLDAAARAYVNHPRGVRISGDSLTLSAIYKWYRADFGGADAAVLHHLGRFASAPLMQRLLDHPKIAGYDYDWSLNDIAAHPR